MTIHPISTAPKDGFILVYSVDAPDGEGEIHGSWWEVSWSGACFETFDGIKLVPGEGGLPVAWHHLPPPPPKGMIMAAIEKSNIAA